MRTHVRVDLGRIAANYAAVRSACPDNFELMAVVKANAYGHGALPVSRALAEAGCGRFGVSSLEEGADLRESGIAGEIFVVGGVLDREADEAARLGLTPMLHSRETYRAWRAAGGAVGQEPAMPSARRDGHEPAGLGARRSRGGRAGGCRARAVAAGGRLHAPGFR